MIGDRRRREEQRVRHAQGIVDAMREQQAELRAELHGEALRVKSEPVELDAYRRAKMQSRLWPLPDDAI